MSLDHTPQWPVGTRLEIAPAKRKIGLDESEWPATDDEKAAWLEWLRTLEPFDMTPTELGNGMGRHVTTYGRLRRAVLQ